MKIDPLILLSFQKHAHSHQGVFSHIDLKNLFLTSNPLIFNRKIKAFLQAGLLIRFSRGFYVTPDCNLEWLSQRIDPHSALSCGTILAKQLVIGSIPNQTIYAVKKGRNRIYQSSVGRIIHLHLSSHLWFGYENSKTGVRQADPEKAFLDTLYFHLKGQKFSFNIYSDIDFSLLDQKKIHLYLKKYKNKKFQTFALSLLKGDSK